MGELIQLRQPEPEYLKRLCFNCEHALVGVSGVYCQMFHEEIFNEAAVAAVCEEYTNNVVPMHQKRSGL